MVGRVRSLLSFGNVVAVIALVAALGLGTAWALERNSVRSKHIVNGQVKELDLTAPEPFHIVGASGEPTFGTGGENDCVWSNHTGFGPHNLVGFYRDPLQRVHLSGIPDSAASGAGDGNCNSSTDAEDARIFTLPAGYRPDTLQYPGSLGGDITKSVLVVGDEDFVNGAQTFKAGGVYALSSLPGGRLLDGLDFRVVGSGAGKVANGEDSPVNTKGGLLHASP